MADTDYQEITKVSEIDVDYLVDYLRIDDASDVQKREIATMLNSAKGYVSSYTGLPIASVADDTATPDVDESTTITLDSKPEFVDAICVLVQHNYDNRALYVDKSETNKVIDSIIGLHRVNLV